MGMVDSIKERCQRICGSTANCFARNSMQVGCVSDMVINKVGHIKLIIERAREENQCEQIAGILDMASKDIDGLINWIRYLQGETIGR